MNLLEYIARRIFFSIFVLLAVLVITFTLSHFISSDPIVAWLGRNATLHPGLAAYYSNKFHFNDPLYVQFYYYLIGLSQGQLGYSPSRGFIPVIQVLQMTIPYTLQIAFFAYIFALVIGISLGVLASRYNHTPVDGAIRAFYLGAASSPAFFIALLVLIIFAFTLGWFPSGNAFGTNVFQPTAITHIPMLDSLLEGNFEYFWSALDHVFLPSLTLAIVTFGILTRVLRASMLDVMQANYIRTARAKGLSEGAVFYRHGLRNAFIPLVTLSTLLIIGLITGTIFVENIFSYPGLGQYVVQALEGQDYPGILSTTLIFAIVIVGANLLADIFYALVDPQIRLG
ncbi:MAG: ABC transporter permease [Thaumarchaeota archaeon]|nr:ABC transporter permease [Nitrososphaerota archaeon]